MKNKKIYKFNPDYAISPMASLKEIFHQMVIELIDLKKSVDFIDSVLLNGGPITDELANKLEIVTGVPARIWNNLEDQYRKQLKKINKNDNIFNCNDENCRTYSQQLNHNFCLKCKLLAKEILEDEDNQIERYIKYAKIVLGY